jgi:hypothetical protein
MLAYIPLVSLMQLAEFILKITIDSRWRLGAEHSPYTKKQHVHVYIRSVQFEQHPKRLMPVGNSYLVLDGPEFGGNRSNMPFGVNL